MHFQFQPKVGVELAGFASIYQDKWAKQQEDNSFNDQEPTSVLHMRSQSPPTSASTLSSSFNGGSGGGGSGGNFTTTTIVPPESTQLEFQPIQSELDLVTTGPVGVQRCNNLGIEDWEAMLFESTVSPSQDQNSLLQEFQPKVGVELAGFASIYQDKWAKQQEDNSFNDQEPTSVLHMRSQSPLTSASTLSSFNGGSGAAVAAVISLLPPLYHLKAPNLSFNRSKVN
ncbi:uncharacterized protein LOC128293146 [Gossypium arboreum]|uniref:uncharacterized protein LOC128293146 n=1 Tax=Gossypium arboreum TaxID=29729 RepID=UPI0022F14B37|nr:uncharacterized protein LOC128293146 [Gossypium arboreum]